eukprot:gene7842-9203_t
MKRNGFSNVDFSFTMSKIVMPITGFLLKLFAVPYFVSRGVIPVLGGSALLENVVLRFGYPIFAGTLLIEQLYFKIRNHYGTAKMLKECIDKSKCTQIFTSSTPPGTPLQHSQSSTSMSMQLTTTPSFASLQPSSSTQLVSSSNSVRFSQNLTTGYPGPNRSPTSSPRASNSNCGSLHSSPSTSRVSRTSGAMQPMDPTEHINKLMTPPSPILSTFGKSGEASVKAESPSCSSSPSTFLANMKRTLSSEKPYASSSSPRPKMNSLAQNVSLLNLLSSNTIPKDHWHCIVSRILELSMSFWSSKYDGNNALGSLNQIELALSAFSEQEQIKKQVSTMDEQRYFSPIIFEMHSRLLPLMEFIRSKTTKSDRDINGVLGIYAIILPSLFNSFSNWVNEVSSSCRKKEMMDSRNNILGKMADTREKHYLHKINIYYLIEYIRNMMFYSYKNYNGSTLYIIVDQFHGIADDIDKILFDTESYEDFEHLQTIASMSDQDGSSSSSGSERSELKSSSLSAISQRTDDGFVEIISSISSRFRKIDTCLADLPQEEPPLKGSLLTLAQQKSIISSCFNHLQTALSIFAASDSFSPKFKVETIPVLKMLLSTLNTLEEHIDAGISVGDLAPGDLLEWTSTFTRISTSLNNLVLKNSSILLASQLVDMCIESVSQPALHKPLANHKKAPSSPFGSPAIHSFLLASRIDEPAFAPISSDQPSSGPAPTGGAEHGPHLPPHRERCAQLVQLSQDSIMMTVMAAFSLVPKEARSAAATPLNNVVDYFTDSLGVFFSAIRTNVFCTYILLNPIYEMQSTPSVMLSEPTLDSNSINFKKKVVDFLNTFIKKRPSPDDLRQKNILTAPSTVSPRIQPSRYDLEKNMKAHPTTQTHARKNSTSRGGKVGQPDTGKKTAWDVLRNLDFTFSKLTIGKTVVHRLKFPQFGLRPDELQELYPDQPDDLETEGLFRVNGSNKDISLLKFRVEDGDLCFDDVTNPYSICGLVSTFFKEMPDPLIPCDMYREAIDSIKNDGKDKIIARLRALVLGLPPSYLCIMRKFFDFLTQIEKHKDVNKMTCDNLGIIFGPTLMRDPDFNDIASGLLNLKHQSLVVKYLVEYYVDVFKSTEVQRAYRKSMKVVPAVDTSSIDYLDLQTESKPRVSLQAPAGGRPRPAPPRRVGTILLSPRDSQVYQRDSQVYAVTTLTRPMSRILNPEIIDSPYKAPPKPPSRKPNPPAAPLTMKSLKTAAAGASSTPGRPLPSPPACPAPPPPVQVATQTRAKPAPPKRTYTSESPPAPSSPVQQPRKNSLNSNVNNINNLATAPVVITPPATAAPPSQPPSLLLNKFDRPPNKPPPNPFEQRYKTTPNPASRSQEASGPKVEAEEPKGPAPIPKRRVQFNATQEGEGAKTSTMPALPRNHSFGESRPIPVPRSNSTVSTTGERAKVSPSSSSTFTTTPSKTIPTTSTTTTTPAKSNSFIKPSTPSSNVDDTEHAKRNFTTQRTSKSALNLTGLVGGDYQPKASPASDISFLKKPPSPSSTPTNISTLKHVLLPQPLRVTQQSPDIALSSSPPTRPLPLPQIKK